MLTSLALLATLAAAPPAQWTQSCQDSSPRLERLAEAVQRGEVDVVRAQLDAGADVEEEWRDGRAPLLCRSLLLRSVWYGQDAVFQLLLKRGADPLKLPRESLQSPVRDGRLDMVRTLLGRGMKPHDNDDILRAGLESRNPAMLDLLLSSGVSINAATFPTYYLTDDITRFLVPKHLGPNTRTYVGTEACTFEKLFGFFTKNWDGCEGTIGPLWLHFVVTRNRPMLRYMIANGADLTAGADVWNGSRSMPFTALDVAAKLKDRAMIDLLRRAGARTP